MNVELFAIDPGLDLAWSVGFCFILYEYDSLSMLLVLEDDHPLTRLFASLVSCIKKYLFCD